jgi:hypothetical protein
MADKSQEILDYQKKFNESLFTSFGDSVAYKEMVKVHESTSRVLQKIDEIKSRMVDLSGGFKGDAHTGDRIDYSLMADPFDPVSTYTLLSPGCENRSELDSLLAGYCHEMSIYAGSQGIDPYSSITSLLPGKPDNRKECTLITSLHALNLAETAILCVESDAFRGLARNQEKSE